MVTVHVERMVSPSLQVLTQVRSLPEILEQTKLAWLSLDRKVFEAAWLTCGYFSIDYFKQFRTLQTDGISTMEEVADCIDPAQVLAGGHILRPTPQFCQVFEWQIQDSCFQTNKIQ